MVTARGDTERFPHIEFREVEGNLEAYLSGSGLAIWEIAWLSRSYGRDAQTIADNHTVVGPELIEEGLQYAAEHADEISVERAEEARRRAQEKLAGTLTTAEETEFQNALAMAEARLRLARMRR